MPMRPASASSCDGRSPMFLDSVKLEDSMLAAPLRSARICTGASAFRICSSSHDGS